jgi:tRNA A-37 threonylcarbamoyl transferase component Bud32
VLRPLDASAGRLLATVVRAGLVAAATACDREVSVEDASRSNPVHIVHVDGVPTFVVKQEGAAVDSGSPLSAEASAYRWLARDPSLAEIAPKVVLFPGELGPLVLEVVPDARPLHELMAELDGDLGPVLAELGRLLARLHTARVRPGLVPMRRPWLLDLAGGITPTFVEPSAEVREIVASIRGRSSLMGSILSVSRTWHATVFMHGDVKWDNVLVGRDAAGVVRLRLVDWEMAGLGDPTWDIAAVVEGLLTTTMLDAGEADPAMVAPLVRQVLLAYGGSAPGHLPSVGRLLTFVAARTVQVAIQLAAMSVAAREDGTAGPESFGAVEGVLALADRIGAEPDEWARKLGIGGG